MRYGYGRKKRYYETSNLTGTKGGWMEDEDDITMAEADEIAGKPGMFKVGLTYEGKLIFHDGYEKASFICVDIVKDGVCFELENDLGEEDFFTCLKPKINEDGVEFVKDEIFVDWHGIHVADFTLWITAD